MDDHGVTGDRSTRLDVVARITRPAIGGDVLVDLQRKAPEVSRVFADGGHGAQAA